MHSTGVLLRGVLECQKVYRADWHGRGFSGQWIHSLAAAAEEPFLTNWAKSPISAGVRPARLALFAGTAIEGAENLDGAGDNFLFARHPGTVAAVSGMAAFPACRLKKALVTGPTFARASASKPWDLCRISLAENY
jgi:hypothetical protein